MLTQPNKNKGSKLRRFSSNPARVIVSSFALLIFVGTILLMLPISSAEGRFHFAVGRLVYCNVGNLCNQGLQCKIQVFIFQDLDKGLF